MCILQNRFKHSQLYLKLKTIFWNYDAIFTLNVICFFYVFHLPTYFNGVFEWKVTDDLADINI